MPQVSNLKTELTDCILADYPIEKREMLVDEILTEYLFLINDIRKDELEDIIVNLFQYNCYYPRFLYSYDIMKQ